MLGERICNSQIVRHKDIRHRQPAQPPREYRAETCNPGQWSQGKSQTHGTRDELESVRAGGGQRRWEMGVYPQKREGPYKGAQ